MCSTFLALALSMTCFEGILLDATSTYVFLVDCCSVAVVVYLFLKPYFFRS